MALASLYNGAAGIERDPAKTAAYFQLFLALSSPDPKQRKWLSDFERQLSPSDRKRAGEIVCSYHHAPTLLTLKGLSGQRAAQELIQETARK